MDLILEEVCVSASLALVGTIALVSISVFIMNKEAKEKGLVENEYNFESSVSAS
jgi:hypothetical protein